MMSATHTVSNDYLIALKLQEDEINTINQNKSSIANESLKRPLSIVDESWELIDPIPDIRQLFLQFNDEYFDGLLAGVEVKWSPRMTLCAGLCSYEGRGGLCSIRLSQPLLKLRPRRDLVQTLLHEMIHAVLFVTHNFKDHDGHGPEFHKHMNRINKLTGAKITVYHTFHDEVNEYKQHWWRCEGCCRSRRPFFGYVKRSMNRAPSRHDTWWAEHERTCGGKFVKIKEPKEYTEKQEKKRKGKENKDGQSLPSKKAFPGTGKQLDSKNTTKLDGWVVRSHTTSTSASTSTFVQRSNNSNSNELGFLKDTSSSISSTTKSTINNNSICIQTTSTTSSTNPSVGKPHSREEKLLSIGRSNTIVKAPGLTSASIARSSFPGQKHIDSKSDDVVIITDSPATIDCHGTSNLCENKPGSSENKALRAGKPDSTIRGAGPTSSAIAISTVPDQRHVGFNSDDIIIITDSPVTIDCHVTCPACFRSVQKNFIHQHLDQCLS